MEIRIKEVIPEDAASVAEVLTSVIAERRYSAFDTPLSVEEERSFIASLGPREALGWDSYPQGTIQREELPVGLRMALEQAVGLVLALP